MFNPLILAANHSRLLLVVGLLIGITMPNAAFLLKPWLSELVAVLLFLAAFRIGAKQALGGLKDIKTGILLVSITQLALPIGMIGLLALIGLLDNPIALPLVLVVAAPAISSSPSLVQMTGHNPAPALRLMILGTLLLPITVFFPFWLLPEIGSTKDTMHATISLLSVIAVVVSLAFVSRHLLLRRPKDRGLKAIDGLNALFMSVVIVGLMSAVAPALKDTPSLFFYWLMIAFIVNYGLQFIAYLIISNTSLKKDRVGYAIITGNRNVSLFLIALDPLVANDLLLFIGCYQIPMFLVPILLQKFYKRQSFNK